MSSSGVPDKGNRLLHGLKHKRDYYAGGLMTLLGLGTVLEASRYKIGSLTHMGPGFFPIMLGVALILIGILIAGSALAARDGEDWPTVLGKPEWRGWLCVIAGPLMFILFGKYGGFATATFAFAVVSALGDRTAALQFPLVLPVDVTVFGVVLFCFLLEVSFTILAWAASLSEPH